MVVTAEVPSAIQEVAVFAVRIVLDLADLYGRGILRLYQLCGLYGPSGVPLAIFGNRTTWRIQAQILGEFKDDDALAFKASVYNECTMIAVAAAIVAQIAITGLSLNYLSQTHWIARALFVLSLTFALMAVYYATTQQRTLGRLLKAKDVRLWIRGGKRQPQDARIVPSFDDILARFRGNRLLAEVGCTQHASGVLHVLFSWMEYSPRGESRSRSLFDLRYVFVSSEPDDYAPDLSTIQDIKRDVIYHCFTPSVASVITISAPQMLLSSSLAVLLIALAIYFGFLWTRNLDPSAGLHDSRNVFITYIVGMAVSGLVYSISQLFQDDEKRSERQIVEEHLNGYLASHPEAVTRWGLDAQPVENGIPLTQMAPRNNESHIEVVHPEVLSA